jgi:hypothetical protein
MGELTLFVLRIGFLVMLWVFVFIIVFALRGDLFGSRVRKMPAPASAPPLAPVRAKPVTTPQSGAVASRLVITAGAKEGLELPLAGDLLSIGRSSESNLIIRDDYTSTHHARLLLGEKGWMIDDLDSTNGTFLAGDRVTKPSLVPLNTPVTIGTTTFELRR